LSRRSAQSGRTYPQADAGELPRSLFANNYCATLFSISTSSERVAVCCSFILRRNAALLATFVASTTRD
jgi:hypothetical protein